MSAGTAGKKKEKKTCIKAYSDRKMCEFRNFVYQLVSKHVSGAVLVSKLNVQRPRNSLVCTVHYTVPYMYIYIYIYIYIYTNIVTFVVCEIPALTIRVQIIGRTF
jgi:hypothetical protein